jgi:hypothetical protein
LGLRKLKITFGLVVPRDPAILRLNSQARYSLDLWGRRHSRAQEQECTLPVLDAFYMIVLGKKFTSKDPILFRNL